MGCDLSSEGLLGLEWINPTDRVNCRFSWLHQQYALEVYFRKQSILGRLSSRMFVFAQNSARILTHISLNKGNHGGGIKDIIWIQLPPKSPDLNLIEHIWQYPNQAYFDS
jgi:hypothetical protein